MTDNTIQMDTLLTDIIVHDTFSLARDADEKAQKLGITLHADFDFSAVTVEEAVNGMAKTKCRIAIQNAIRGDFDGFVDGQQLGIIPVSAAGRKVAVDAEVVVANRFASADRDGKIEQLMTITGLDHDKAAFIVDEQADKS